MGLQEIADLKYDRGGSVQESMAAWYAAERKSLLKRIAFYGEDIASISSPALRSQMASQLRAAEAKLAELDRGWKNSSLRRGLKRSEGSRRSSIVEVRIASNPPARIQIPAARSADVSIVGKINGYSAVFKQDSLPLWDWGGEFIEQLMPGCFDKALARSDVRCLYNHQPDAGVLGRSSAGTLKLKTDSHGLWFSCDLIDGDEAIFQRISRGDISGCSFKFTVLSPGGDYYKLAQHPGDIDRRYITEIEELIDVGPVCWPAYPSTNVVAKAEKNPARHHEYSQEDFLRDELEEDLRIEAEEKETQRLRCRAVKIKYDHAGRILNRVSEKIRESKEAKLTG